MGRVDDLIAQVTDTKLRKELADSIGDFKRRQRLGIVYEEHIPETEAIPGIPVQVGSLVQVRTNSGSLWRVTGFKEGGKVAKIRAFNNGVEESTSTKDLLTVKRLGEPIFPWLKPLGALRRGGKKPFHAVINGENYHALQLLDYMFEGRVDCIYIDPPYNTGARDWRYNNRYVDTNDVWRHSKWLSMMEKRLRLAKRLLRSDGVLIVTIDEHEIHHLGMLLEKLFPEYLRYMVTVVINPKGTAKANFSRVDEQVFFVVPVTETDVISPRRVAPSGQTDMALYGEEESEPAADVDESETKDDEVEDSSLEWEYRHARRRGSESSYRHQRPNQFYPIYIDEKANKVVRAGASIPKEAKPSFSKVNGLRPVWPIDAEGRERCWAFVPESMQAIIDAGNLFLGKYHPDRNTWTLNYRVPRKLTRKLKTVWFDRAYDAGTHGTELLRRLLGEPGLFPFPKSVYAVKDCLAAVVGNRPNALIVDFFAGSGTTFHATCLLNLDDGGNRKSILVTNNEVSMETASSLHKENLYRGDPEFEKWGIFERVTRPRCEAIITGHRPDGTPIEGNHLDKEGRSRGRPFSTGFEENVEFYELEYLDPDDIELGNSLEALLPSLWLASGGIGDRQIRVKDIGFSIPEKSTYGVLLKESRFRRFKEALLKRPDVTHTWLVTDSEEAFAEMRSALPKEVNTSMLYRDYLSSFKTSAGRP